ncbi:hypothetical protein SNK03_006172 [Fusarium graminearum]
MSANRENTLHDLRIDVSALPDITQPEMDFLDSSFFQTRDSTQARPQLPTPASLFEEYGDCGADVITIKELNLAIKTDAQAYLNLEEVQTLWVIRKVFPNGDVPVPELFSWRKYGDWVFIYMSLVPGETLREVWQSLDEDDKASLQNRLKEIIGTLRKLKQSPEIIGECIQCLRFDCPLNHLRALPAEDHYKTVSFG